MEFRASSSVFHSSGKHIPRGFYSLYEPILSFGSFWRCIDEFCYQKDQSKYSVWHSSCSFYVRRPRQSHSQFSIEDGPSERRESTCWSASLFCFYYCFWRRIPSCAEPALEVLLWWASSSKRRDSRTPSPNVRMSSFLSVISRRMPLFNLSILVWISLLLSSCRVQEDWYHLDAYDWHHL